MSVDLDYINNVYTSLSKMDLELDPDPIEFGPSKLNNKTAEARKYLSQTEKVFMEVSQNLHKYKRDLLIAETQFNLEETKLMANDPHVRSGRSQQEREALASTQLVHIQSKINSCKLATHDLEDVLKVVKAKRTDLKDIQGRLRDQLKLCQEQISLGQRWGQKVDKIIAGDLLSVDDLGSEDNVLIKADSSILSDEEYVDSILSVAVGVDLPNVSSDMNEVDKFLDSPLQKVDHKMIDDFDLDSLLDDL
jgi:hypothetical protein